MGFLEDILAGRNPYGNMPDKREVFAQDALKRQGSVMAKPEKEQYRKDNPMLDAVMGTINTLLDFGPNPLDAGGGAAAHVPGTYRKLGMERISGILNPKEYIDQLAQQPNYPRYLELIQGMVRKALGESFPVARGAAQTDPLIQALQTGNKQLPATAVTHGPWLKDDFASTAESFAREAAEGGRKTSFVAYGKATPKDVGGIVPNRGTTLGERELVLTPQSDLAMSLNARYTPPSGQFPYTERIAMTPYEELQQALKLASQPVGGIKEQLLNIPYKAGRAGKDATKPAGIKLSGDILGKSMYLNPEGLKLSDKAKKSLENIFDPVSGLFYGEMPK